MYDTCHSSTVEHCSAGNQMLRRTNSGYTLGRPPRPLPSEHGPRRPGQLRRPLAAAAGFKAQMFGPGPAGRGMVTAQPTRTAEPCADDRLLHDITLSYNISEHSETSVVLIRIGFIWSNSCFEHGRKSNSLATLHVRETASRMSSFAPFDLLLSLLL